MPADPSVRTTNAKLVAIVPKGGGINLRVTVLGETGPWAGRALARPEGAALAIAEDRSAAALEERSNGGTLSARHHHPPLCPRSTALIFPMIAGLSRLPNKSR